MKSICNVWYIKFVTWGCFWGTFCIYAFDCKIFFVPLACGVFSNVGKRVTVGTASESKVWHIPECIFMISECLLRKHHDGAGVDRQGQPVIQVHVLQPVVIDLNTHIEMLFEKCWFVKRSGHKLLPSELGPVCSRVKTHYRLSLPDEKAGGSESAWEWESDRFHPAGWAADWLIRRRSRGWGNKGWVVAQINLYRQVIIFFKSFMSPTIFSRVEFLTEKLQLNKIEAAAAEQKHSCRRGWVQHFWLQVMMNDVNEVKSSITVLRFTK